MAAGNPPTIIASIAASASLSGAVDLGGARLARILMPSEWTAANLTFQASTDGETFNNLYDQYGTEYTVTAAAARDIIVNLTDFLGVRFLKVRSGIAASAVTQAAAREVTLVLVN